MIPMNKSATIRKLGSILQTKKATKEEVKEAYENSGVLHYADIEKAMVDIIDPMKPIIEQVMSQIRVEEENQVLRAVRDVNIIVDRERLVQALNDAKEFYNEGYVAGSKATKWISVEDRVPDKGGAYLCAVNGVVRKNFVSVCNFSFNLHELDEFDFPKEKRPGWYGYDSECGYYEIGGVKYWMPMPEPPKEDVNYGE